MPEEEQKEDVYKKAVEKRYREMQIERAKKDTIKKYMTPEAFERFMNVRVANRELYTKLTDWILAMAQSQKIEGRITEEQLKEILARLTQRSEPRIEFKHK